MSQRWFIRNLDGAPAGRSERHGTWTELEPEDARFEAEAAFEAAARLGLVADFALAADFSFAADFGLA